MLIDINNIFKLNEFDAIIGNPPYSKFKNGIKSAYGGKSLWDKFVTISLQKWLVQDGFLLFIHPPSWRKPEHYLWKIMSNKQIIYLKAFSEREGKAMFGCSISTDFYLLKNKGTYQDTKFCGEDNVNYSIDLRNIFFLPSGFINEITKILIPYNNSLTLDNTYELIYSRTLYGTDKSNISSIQNAINCYPVVHSMTKNKGIGLVYSNKNNGHFNVPKVILSFGRNQYPYNDWEGKYGMSQSCFGLKIDSYEHGEKIITVINSDKFKNVLKYTKWNTFQTEWRMFKYIKQKFWEGNNWH